MVPTIGISTANPLSLPCSAIRRHFDSSPFETILSTSQIVPSFTTVISMMIRSVLEIRNKATRCHNASVDLTLRIMSESEKQFKLYRLLSSAASRAKCFSLRTIMSMPGRRTNGNKKKLELRRSIGEEKKTLSSF